MARWIVLRHARGCDVFHARDAKSGVYRTPHGPVRGHAGAFAPMRGLRARLRTFADGDAWFRAARPRSRTPWVLGWSIAGLGVLSAIARPAIPPAAVPDARPRAVVASPAAPPVPPKARAVAKRPGAGPKKMALAAQERLEWKRLYLEGYAVEVIRPAKALEKYLLVTHQAPEGSVFWLKARKRMDLLRRHGSPPGRAKHGESSEKSVTVLGPRE